MSKSGVDTSEDLERRARQLARKLARARAGVGELEDAKRTARSIVVDAKQRVMVMQDDEQLLATCRREILEGAWVRFSEAIGADELSLLTGEVVRNLFEASASSMPIEETAQNRFQVISNNRSTFVRAVWAEAIAKLERIRVVQLASVNVSATVH